MTGRTLLLLHSVALSLSLLVQSCGSHKNVEATSSPVAEPAQWDFRVMLVCDGGTLRLESYKNGVSLDRAGLQYRIVGKDGFVLDKLIPYFDMDDGETYGSREYPLKHKVSVDRNKATITIAQYDQQEMLETIYRTCIDKSAVESTEESTEESQKSILN
jgi:hypothetical protein